MRRIIAVSVVSMFLSAGAAFAAETNFKPANMSGDSPAPEQHSRIPRAENAEPKGPGFWSKEAKRSGLDRVFTLGGLLGGDDSKS